MQCLFWYHPRLKEKGIGILGEGWRRGLWTGPAALGEGHKQPLINPGGWQGAEGINILTSLSSLPLNSAEASHWKSEGKGTLVYNLYKLSSELDNKKGQGGGQIWRAKGMHPAEHSSAISRTTAWSPDSTLVPLHPFFMLQLT